MTEEDKSDMLLQEGVEVMGEGVLDMAYIYFSSAITRNPNNATAYAVRGLVGKTLGFDPAEIEQDFERAIEIDPTWRWNVIAMKSGQIKVEDFAKFSEYAKEAETTTGTEETNREDTLCVSKAESDKKIDNRIKEEVKKMNNERILVIYIVFGGLGMLFGIVFDSLFAGLLSGIFIGFVLQKIMD
jgi:Tfp pilus assembly protein PilF